MTSTKNIVPVSPDEISLEEFAVPPKVLPAAPAAPAEKVLVWEDIRPNETKKVHELRLAHGKIWNDLAAAKKLVEKVRKLEKAAWAEYVAAKKLAKN